MPAVLNAAAHKVNTDTAGVTGPPADPTQAPGAKLPASPAEVLSYIPTEFGDLTGLFGGNPGPSDQYVPVNASLTIPSGSRAGALGGLVPDFRNTLSSGEAAVAEAAPVAAPVRDALGRIFTPGPSLEQQVGDQPPPGAPSTPWSMPPISVVATNAVNRFRAWAKI